MNIATALQFDSISLLAWTETVIRHTRKAAARSQIILKAFNKTIAPVVATTAVDLGRYYILCGQGAAQWVMNAAGIQHNPIQSAVKAAYAELASPASIATYRRIRTIASETAMDGLIIGLCGVVAVSFSIEQAQKGYELVQKGCRATQKLYGKVNARLNPSEPQPELLPSCEMALASIELAAALDKFATIVEAGAKTQADEKANAEAEVRYSLESLKQEQAETLRMIGQIWNPEPRNMHQEVANLLQLQFAPASHAPAPELQPRQKPARKSRAKANSQPQAKGQRKQRAKSTEGVKA